MINNPCNYLSLQDFLKNLYLYVQSDNTFLPYTHWNESLIHKEGQEII